MEEVDQLKLHVRALELEVAELVNEKITLRQQVVMYEQIIQQAQEEEDNEKE